jgi:hypothetical protein
VLRGLFRRAHDVRGWYWSFAALGFMGFIGYVNAEVNARFNPEENAHVMVFYGQILRMLQISGLLLAAETSCFGCG